MDERIRRALKNLYDEIRIRANHRRGVRAVERYLREMRPLRVQFGCGQTPKAGWLNTDLWPGPWATPDICLDVSRVLPFPDGSVAEIYSEHLLEHLDYPAAARLFLAECFRVLEKGGTMTVGVPDLDGIDERYHALSRENRSASAESPQYILNHPAEELNDCFHQQGEHKFLYNEQFLGALLRYFGFTNVARRAFDPAVDSEHRREGTLYMVARK